MMFVPWGGRSRAKPPFLLWRRGASPLDRSRGLLPALVSRSLGRWSPFDQLSGVPVTVQTTAIWAMAAVLSFPTCWLGRLLPPSSRSTGRCSPCAQTSWGAREGRSLLSRDRRSGCGGGAPPLSDLRTPPGPPLHLVKVLFPVRAGARGLASPPLVFDRGSRAFFRLGLVSGWGRPSRLDRARGRLVGGRGASPPPLWRRAVAGARRSSPAVLLEFFVAAWAVRLLLPRLGDCGGPSARRVLVGGRLAIFCRASPSRLWCRAVGGAHAPPWRFRLM